MVDGILQENNGTTNGDNAARSIVLSKDYKPCEPSSLVG
jgi:hypothetical protein